MSAPAEHSGSDGETRSPCAADHASGEQAHRRTGYVHVYIGEGKGKTSAALGLALRALGHGQAVFIGQFMKAGSKGEVAALRSFSHATVEQFGQQGLPPGEVETDPRRRARRGFERSLEALASGRYDVVILDEFDIVMSFGLLPVSDCFALLDSRPQSVELVLTGRSAPTELIDRADLVTEMREVKHYYRRGVSARAGIEY